jgi:hypothetical protein
MKAAVVLLVGFVIALAVALLAPSTVDAVHLMRQTVGPDAIPMTCDDYVAIRTGAR